MKSQSDGDQEDKNRQLHCEKILASLAVEGKKVFCKLAPPQIYPAGTRLQKENSLSVNVYYIDIGLVKLVSLNQDGREMIVGLRYPGWILGAAPVIAQRPNTLRAVTLIQSQLRCIPAEDLLHLARTESKFSWHLNQLLSYEIHDLLSYSIRLGTLSARRRLEELLLHLISVLELKKSQSGIRLQMPLKREEIAQMIAVSPEHVSRMLKQMKREGVIRKEKGWIFIPDLQKLTTMDTA